MLRYVLSPINIGNIKIRNRFIASPMVTNFCTDKGFATEKYIAYHEAKAKGGWGLIITENYAIDPNGKAFSNVPGLWDDSQIQSHSELTRRVHAYGAKIFAQIYHAGRQTTKYIIGTEPSAPTPIACPILHETPHELTISEIQKIVEQFGDCALRAKEAGFDGVEVHGAHGYLVSQFMSPYSNKRIDYYGGSFFNRMRFPIEVISNIRKKCGKDFCLEFRISGDEMVPGGRTIEDTKAIAMMLEEVGVDALHVSVGVNGSGYTIVPAAVMGHGWLCDFSAEIKKVTNIPVFVVGRVNDPHIAEAIIASGKADAVVMGRASLADPDLPNKAGEGSFEDIRYCTACLHCLTRLDAHLPIQCACNPSTGREQEFLIKPAKRKKRVFIAGGGPAGMEAAIVATKRGHNVQIFEKESRLGGQLYTASIPPWKGEIAAFPAWQIRTLENLGVKINLNVALTVDIVSTLKPDVVIIATGSIPIVPKISGIDLGFVSYATEALLGKISVGENVAIIGGGMIGSETANHLAHHGKNVTIIDVLPEIAKEEPENLKRFLMISFKENNVITYLKSAVQTINANGTMIILQDGITKKIGKFENVLIATGMRSQSILKAEIEGIVDEIYVVGDAKEVRKYIEATQEGYEIALKI